MDGPEQGLVGEGQGIRKTVLKTLVTAVLLRGSKQATIRRPGQRARKDSKVPSIAVG